MNSHNNLASALPPFQGISKVISTDQDVKDIMKEILQAHKVFAKDYDNIAPYFIGGSDVQIAKKLFNFCKKNIPYKIEPVSSQTTRSPGGILKTAKLMGADCKHYASFIGGVLDAIGRLEGRKINWWYRFASYKLFNKVPGHVFVVLKTNGQEYWIDPVLENFNQRDPEPNYIVDEKVKSSMRSLSGINNNKQIGVIRSQVIVSRNAGCSCNGNIGEVATATPEKPNVAAAILSAIPILGAFIAQLFAGRKELESTSVRWLVSFYKINVAGLYGNYGDYNDDVSEASADRAQAWFSAVLGVPIYDLDRFYTLLGLATKPFFVVRDNRTGIIKNQSYPPDTSIDSFSKLPKQSLVKSVKIGDSLGISDAEKVDNYKKFWDSEGVPDEDIYQAIKIANWMKSTIYDEATGRTTTNKPGNWKNMLLAPSLLTKGLRSEVAVYTNPVTATTNPVNTNPVNTNNTTMPEFQNNTSIKDIAKSNPLATAGIVVLGAWGLMEISKSKKVSGVGKIDTNTWLLLGGAAAGVYFLTRNKQQVPQGPVYQPTYPLPGQYPGQYPSTQPQTTNVWGFLDSLVDLATGLFVKNPKPSATAANNNTNTSYWT